MAEASESNEGSLTVTETTEQQPSTSPHIVLKLKKPKSSRQVKWTTETVDNEHLNKKKSKCCCIYEKPKLFGESSSEDEGDCTGHCHGHKKKCFRSHGDQDGDGAGPSSEGSEPPPPEET